jgi:hypothetical protein
MIAILAVFPGALRGCASIALLLILFVIAAPYILPQRPVEPVHLARDGSGEQASHRIRLQ